MKPEEKDAQVLNIRKSKLFLKAIQNNETNFALPDDDTGLTYLLGDKKYTYDDNTPDRPPYFPRNIRQREKRNVYNWDIQKTGLYIDRVLQFLEEFYYTAGDEREKEDGGDRSLQQIIDRDSQKRDAIKSNIENDNDESFLLLDNTEKYLRGFQYLYDFETKKSKIPDRPDLVFTNGFGIFVIVEMQKRAPNKGITKKWQKKKNDFYEHNHDDDIVAVLGAAFIAKTTTDSAIDTVSSGEDGDGGNESKLIFLQMDKRIAMSVAKIAKGREKKPNGATEAYNDPLEIDQTTINATSSPNIEGSREAEEKTTIQNHTRTSSIIKDFVELL
ncbi:12409_t:CDS:2, partial [Ambispora leptoticha]